MSIDIELRCQECGDSLDTSIRTGGFQNHAWLEVPPCETCLRKAKEEADEAGYDRGYDKGLERGRKEASNG